MDSLGEFVLTGNGRRIAAEPWDKDSLFKYKLLMASVQRHVAFDGRTRPTSMAS
jgi:hypothetical protein